MDFDLKARYLRRHDEAIRRIMDTVEMPDRVAENLVMFIRQNKVRCQKSGVTANSINCGMRK